VRLIEELVLVVIGACVVVVVVILSVVVELPLDVLIPLVVRTVLKL
jgi:hypothetical protein